MEVGRALLAGVDETYVVRMKTDPDGPADENQADPQSPDRLKLAVSPGILGRRWSPRDLPCGQGHKVLDRSDMVEQVRQTTDMGRL